MISRNLKLPQDEGTKFYDFEHILNMKEWKDMYRKKLDSLPIDVLCADKIVDEANTAFHLNINLFQLLEEEIQHDESLQPRTLKSSINSRTVLLFVFLILFVAIYVNKRIPFPL